MRPERTCRWCNQPVRWVISERGRNMCLDPQPSTLGNVVLIATASGTRARVVAADELAARRKQIGQLWMPHAATCPHIGRNRTRGHL